MENDCPEQLEGNALSAACANGHLQIVKLLLARGMSDGFSDLGPSAICAACTHGRTSLLEYLFQQTATDRDELSNALICVLVSEAHDQW